MATSDSTIASLLQRCQLKEQVDDKVYNTQMKTKNPGGCTPGLHL